MSSEPKVQADAVNLSTFLASLSRRLDKLHADIYALREAVKHLRREVRDLRLGRGADDGE